MNTIEKHASGLRKAKTFETAKKHLEALRIIGTPEAALAIAKHGLTHDNKRIVGVSPVHLSHIGTKETVPYLVKHGLKHKDYTIVFSAAEALGNIGDKSAVDPLIKILRDPEKHNTRVRGAAAMALGKIGGKKALEALTERLLNDFEREHADEWPDWRLGEFTRYEYARAIAKMGTKKAIDWLINKGLSHERTMVVKHCAEALGETDEKRVLPKLMTLTAHPNKHVVAAVKTSIKKIQKRLKNAN